MLVIGHLSKKATFLTADHPQDTINLLLAKPLILDNTRSPASQILVDILRRILIQHNLSESTAPEMTAFSVSAETRDEVLLQFDGYNDGSPAGDSDFNAARDGLLRCCQTILSRGYTVTLVCSPRTLALYVNVAV